MSEISNLDKICAEIGFYACDIYNELCNVLREEIRSFRNYSEFESNKENIIKKIKEKVGKEDEDLIKSILNKIVNEKSFNELRKNPPKFDPKELERVITKALGILIEDGLFAYSIWLKSEDENPHRAIIASSLELLKNEKINLTNKNDLIEAILDISNELQKTILAKQLLEKMLIYARYRAKALQSD